jgi:hypothetical protein
VLIVYITKVKSKIISFGGHFQRNTQRPLSRLMIVALIEACERQKQGLLFGPCDLKGSFTVLIKRGLIITKKININGRAESSWHVTTEALEMLKPMGITVPL